MSNGLFPFGLAPFGGSTEEAASSGASASVSKTLGALTSSATAQVIARAALSRTLASLVSSAPTQVFGKASLDRTLAGIVATIVASHSTGLNASAANTLAGVTNYAIAKAVASVMLSTGLTGVMSSATLRARVQASVSKTLASVTSSTTIPEGPEVPLSYEQFAGNGSNQNFAVNFGYIDRAHISVKVNGVAQTFTFLSDNLVQLAVAPADGTTVEVRRTTPRDQPLVDFSDGSTLTEEDLDTSFLQNFYIAQETRDDTSIEAALDAVQDAQDARDAALAAVSSVNLPSISGQPLKFLRVKSDSSGYDLLASTALLDALSFGSARADVATAGTITDYDLGASTRVIRLTAATTLDSIANGAENRRVVVLNGRGDATPITISNGAIGANKIKTGVGTDITLHQNQALTLFYDTGATQWRVAGYVTQAGFSRMTVLTSGSGNWTVPVGVHTAFAEGWGGGGGGGGGNTNGSNWRGSGGSSGGYSNKLLTGLTPGTNLAYAIGGAGAGGASGNPANAGTSGGDTTFAGLLTAKGGAGGTAANGSSTVNGVAGVAGNVGDFTILGGASQVGAGNPLASGAALGPAFVSAGGNAPRGGMGGSLNVGDAGADPAAGGTCGNHTAATNGGAGGSGRLVIWY